MMKSILLTIVKHSNISHSTTSLARRAFLLISFLLLGLGNVWGQEEQDLWNGSGYFEIQGSEFESNFGTSTEIVLRIYCDLTSGSVTFQTFWGNQPFDKATYTSNDAIYDAVGHFLEFNLNLETISILINQSLKGWVNDGSTLTRVTWYIPVPDTFEDPNKSPNNAGTYIEKYLTDQTPTPLPLDITKATALLNGQSPTYARFYVLHNDEPLDLSKNDGLLEITGVTPAAQLPKKGIYGYYLYSSGSALNLENISVRLNAEAGKFPEYQVICVLSTSQARTATDNEVTEEPNWDVMFTYAFRNQVETNNQTGEVAWDAVAMTASVSTNNITEDWGTSWSNLAQEQKIQWYVTNGTGEEQPLAIGTERQNDTWTINLPMPFSMNGNIAILTGQTTYDATSFEAMWNIWGNPAVYAPANKSFADVQDYQIICKIADDAEGQALPNVIYTFSLTNTFPGQEKATIVKTAQQVKLEKAAQSAILKNFSLPEETKYVRFYIVDQNGDIANDKFWLTENSLQERKDGDATGWYIYEASGVSLESVIINSNSANLDEYQVIMVTSSETAVASGSTVTYEPDYDTQTTFWFKYPVDTWTVEENTEVEWSPQSMQIVAPNIDISGDEVGKKGVGYLEKIRQHYTLEWTVVDESGNAQPLCIGNSRVDDYWSVNIVANPFVLTNDNKALTVSNDPNLNIITWSSWAAPQIYAPKNKTMKQIVDAGIKFVCKLYEDDEAGDPNMLAMTYTINIVRTEELGQLKDGGLYYEKIIEDITHDQEDFKFDSSEPLENAVKAFLEEIGKPATYVRIYLTRNDGTPLHPGDDEDEDEQLMIDDANLFENNKRYGYYFHDNGGVDLSGVIATLKLPAGSFTYYNVVVAMSGDTDDIDFTGDFYEPDYDYVYTFKFVETSSFPGTLVESLITHTKEIRIKVEDKDKPVLIPLHEETTVNEFLNELGAADGFENMAKQYYHVRWFVAKKNDDGTYEKLAGSENMLDAVSTDWAGTTITGTRTDLSHVKRRNQGIYWNSACVSNLYNYSTDIIKVSFTKPADGNWSDYQVVVWMTNSSDNATIIDGTLSHEPDIKVQYIFSFVNEESLSDLPFVHYQGEAYRYLKEKGEDVAAQQRDYLILDGDAWLQEYTWNIATSSYEPISGNIRQSVHTWEYDIYVAPGETRPLILPFQLYDSVSRWGDTDDSGNEDEPCAYIRWYDWKTDTKVIGNNFVFDKTENSQLNENDYGLFGLCVPDNPIHKRVGVTFTPNADFTETFDVACDVSKYSDGIVNVDGKYHLLHEPTLSSRYIFHIHPASEMADRFVNAKQNLADAENTGDAETLFDTMSELEEDKGKVIVSIKDENTQFSLRFDQQYLDSYILRDGDGYVSAKEVQWYAYTENNGNILKQSVLWEETDQTKRIYTFNYGKFKEISNGIIHVVGYVGKKGFNIGNATDVYAPVVHYELQFIEAPPIPLTNILSNLTEDKIKYKERMESYMNLHYEVKGVVDFDGNPETNENVKKNPYEAMYYYSTPHWDDKPSSSLDNLSYVPYPWDNIQYGFCYPQLTPTVQNGYRERKYTSPEHSDYTILKTMNVSPYSTSNNGETSPYMFQWWNGTPLYDYTYNATKETDSPQYGSFLYVDASDESRTIATIPFTAELCSGSSFYFTAVVANMTAGADSDGYDDGEHTVPQLLIRIVGIKEDGTRKRIVAFHTANLDKTQNVKMGQWYQVYGASTLSKDFDTSITHFEAEVINYAKHTYGADFAIDQIMIYTSTSKVLLTQTGDASCKPNEDEVEPDKVKAYMEADGLQNAFGVSDELQPIYWRICDEDNGEVITGPGMYPQYDQEGNLTPDDGTFTYGVTWVKSNFSDGDLGLINEEHPYGWYYDSTTEKYFFQIADKTFDALEEGKHYYVSVFDPTAGIENINDDHFWGGLYFGAKNRCSIYSEFFVPRRQYVTYTYGKNGTEGGELTIACGGVGAKVEGIQMILKIPDSDEPTGYKNYTNFHYDYAYVPLKTWKSPDATFGYNGKTYKYTDLSDALNDYRTTDNNKYAQETTVHSDYSNKVGDVDYAEILNAAVSAGILELACSESFTHEFDQVGNYAITCIPVEKYINIGGSPIEICAPFEVTFKLKNSGGPSLTLGFEGVDYTNKGIRVVRVGLEQLNNMKSNYLLHIPVHSYKTDADAKEKEGTVLIDGNLEMLQYQEAAEQTNDKDWNENIDVATFANDKINKDNMYISVNFNGITNPAMPTFKEGFTYRMFFLVKNEGAEDGACEGKVEFLMKVVPEYVTWNDKGTEVTPNSNQNTNWNNDANWSRSKKEELHKTSGYQNNGTEVGDNGATSTPATFVPMKFTYVTIPSDNVAPNLIELETGTTVGTDYGIYTNIGEGATPNIQYDMMVKVEDECSHDIGGNVYDCETFYGNWAKEIYFKPRAELVNQQYLTYEKVWVEKELTANTWTLMSTPLQNTYAGDMYVPINGRQETEAFTDINFGNGYSRTLYPIYQKSWKQEGSKVYTMTNDVRATKYEAGLKGGVTSTLSLWSHTYNDVQEPYSQWKGFAIRAHKKEQKSKALLRLPKEDTNYSYYDWNGTSQEPAAGDGVKEVAKATTGKLFTDNEENISGLTYGVKYGTQERTAGDGDVSVKIGEIQNNNYYLLVGNPYLCSMDMARFLKANETILENAYWTYEHNAIESPYTKGTIKPLQSFFVKVRDGVTNGDTNITFTSAMMVDGNTNPTSPSAVSAMTMTAANERGQSTATLSVGEEMKSVETLFDSNLEEVPMVYTVADGQAVSIQQLTDLDKPVAFGVACAASDELVEVTFSDIAQLTEGDLFVLDAMTGEQTKVGEGDGYSVQPNDYGRYFLLAGATNISDKVDVQKGIMVSVRGKEVIVISGEELTLVHALSLTGAIVYQDAARSTTASFSLPSGVYIIKVENVAGEQQTVKVIVK